MTIEELKDKHENYSTDYPTAHTKLSIQFAIEVLEELYEEFESMSSDDGIWCKLTVEYKIEELKQHLDETG